MYLGKQTVLKIDPLSCPAGTVPEYVYYLWGVYEKFHCKSYLE